MEQEKKKGYSSSLWIIIVLVVVVVAILWATGVLRSGASSGAYQAVFLTNNQVYFGKLSNQNSQFPVLRDIYYLQVTQALQPADQTTPVTNLNLVKLGSEIHGPQDAMFINRDQILFFEDLKADSQIAKAIEQSKARSAQP